MSHITNPPPPQGASCFRCGTNRNLETHECFGGSNRNLSIQYSLQVFLCDECHRGTSGVHGKNGLSLANELKAYGQRIWLDNHGTKEDFIRIFAVRWLLD